MPPDKTTLCEKRMYNLRCLPNSASRARIRHKPYAKSKPKKSRKKSSNSKPKQKQPHSTEDKMIQTHGSEDFGGEYARLGGQNETHSGSEPKVQSPSPIPDLTEGDISSLLGIFNPTSSTSSSAAMPVQTLAQVSAPSSPSQCGSRLHCPGCSCARPAPWCPAHGCALFPPNLSATGCRSSTLHPAALCSGSCPCSGLLRHTLCSTLSSNGPTA